MKGKCIMYNKTYNCNCNENYTGEYCNKCDIGFYKNNNTCVSCTPGSSYWGTYCQKCPECNNGVCLDGKEGDGSCLCDKDIQVIVNIVIVIIMVHT